MLRARLSHENFITAICATYGITVYEPPKVTNAVRVKKADNLIQNGKSRPKIPNRSNGRLPIAAHPPTMRMIGQSTAPGA